MLECVILYYPKQMRLDWCPLCYIFRFILIDFLINVKITHNCFFLMCAECLQLIKMAVVVSFIFGIIFVSLMLS